MNARPWTRLPILTILACLLTPVAGPAQATPKPVTPLVNGDKVLFIGNSFSDWFGPLPSAIQAIIAASCSGLDVDFTIKVKGMGILKEYATWSSLGMVDEIRKGGWKYVVIQGWEDAISRKDSQTDEGGNPISDYLGWPACQDTMLKYLRVLDGEVTGVGATTILYEPHVGASGYLTSLDRSNQTYAMLRSQVSLFHAPIITAWDSLRYRYPSSVYDCSGSPGSFIPMLYHDCGHQNTNGMALDAATFYTIFTRRSAETLKPVFPNPMVDTTKYEEFAALGYKIGKQILALNNCGFTDSQAPTTPAGLQASNIMQDSYVLTWTASTDNVGVLGYRVYRDNVPIGTTPTPRFSVGGLAAATIYQMTVEAFDSERNTSARSAALPVTTSASVAIDTAGVLMAWKFRGTGMASALADQVMVGVSNTLPSGQITTGPAFITSGFGSNSLSVRNQTQTTLAAAITAQQYMPFTIAPVAGNRISIDSIRLRPFTQNRSRNFTIMSSRAGFVDGSEVGTVSSGASSGGPLQTVRVSNHDSITAALDLRLYIWGYTDQWESCGLGNRSDTTLMDLLIYGKVKSSGGASFPTNLAAANLTETGFTLRWAGVAGATQYEVFRDAVSLGTTDSLAFAVTGVTINTTYAMTVRAQTGGGTWSELSLPLQVTIPDQTAPTTPGNLSVTGITENSFVLHWDPASDNVAVTRYEILMNGSLYGNTVDDYLPVPYLQPATRYSMQVRARDQAGNVSGLSDSLVVFTSPTGVAPAAARQPGPAAAVIAFRHAGTVCTRDLGPAGAAGPLSLRVSDMRGRTLLCLGSLSPGLRVDATWLPKGAHVLDLRRGTSHSRSMLLVD